MLKNENNYYKLQHLLQLRAVQFTFLLPSSNNYCYFSSDWESELEFKTSILFNGELYFFCQCLKGHFILSLSSQAPSAARVSLSLSFNTPSSLSLHPM